MNKKNLRPYNNFTLGNIYTKFLNGSGRRVYKIKF